MKNEIKLVCLDLDGTLLTSKKEIDNETIEYLRKLSSNGVNIAIATGRAAFDSKYHAKLIDEEAYFLGSNGSAVGSVEKRHCYLKNVWIYMELKEYVMLQQS